jgi:predicted nucleic acid-binding protein
LSALALDTSVAVPLLLRHHDFHAVVVDWWDGQQSALPGHALAETYSVMTRLPGDGRLTPQDAARLLADRFATPLLLDPETSRRLPAKLAELEIFGGAVYDALVGLAAVEHDATLATRDARARATYERVGARIVLAP